MPLSDFTKVDDFVNQLALGTHDLENDTLKAVLTNTAPTAANTQLSDITEIAAGNGYPAGGLTLDNNTVTETGGVAKLTISTEVMDASGGDIGPYRYVVLYNSTPANGPLIGFYDYGETLTTQDGESFSIEFDATNGVATIE